MTQRELEIVDGLAQLSFLVQGILAARAGDHDISPIQTRLLGVLRDRTPTMNELARLLELDKSSVTGLVTRAEQRGLVQRAPSSSDGRSTVVTLTAAGRRLVRAVSRRFTADVEDLLDGLSATERRALVRLVNRVVVGHAERRGVDLFDTRRLFGSSAV